MVIMNLAIFRAPSAWNTCFTPAHGSAMSVPVWCLILPPRGCFRSKMPLPDVTILVRLVSEIRERANQQPGNKLAVLPDSWQTARFTNLLNIPEGQRVSQLEQLKKVLLLSADQRLLRRWSDISDCVIWSASRHDVGKIHRTYATAEKTGRSHRIR